MASLSIVEFSSLVDIMSRPPGQSPTFITGQMANLENITAVQASVAIGATSLASAAFNAATRFARIDTDVDCIIAYGTTPDATTSTFRLKAGTTEYFGVAPLKKIAVKTP